MGLIDASTLIPDDDEDIAEEKLCPVCRVNYISRDEDMCSDCRRQKEKEEDEDNDENYDWREYVEDDSADEQSSEISLSEYEEDEEEEEEDRERFKLPVPCLLEISLFVIEVVATRFMGETRGDLDV